MVASFKKVNKGVTGDACFRLTKRNLAPTGIADVGDATKLYHVRSARVDPRMMDFLEGIGNLSGNAPFFDHPVIPFDQLSLFNLPPYGLRLSDNQTTHLEIWLRMTQDGEKEDRLPARLFTVLWPANFDGDGWVEITGNAGEAWDHRLPANFGSVRHVFPPRYRAWSLRDLEAALTGGPIPVVSARADFGLRPSFSSNFLAMDYGGVLQFAETIGPNYSLHGKRMTRLQLKQWLLRDFPRTVPSNTDLFGALSASSRPTSEAAGLLASQNHSIKSPSQEQLRRQYQALEKEFENEKKKVVDERKKVANERKLVNAERKQVDEERKTVVVLEKQLSESNEEKSKLEEQISRLEERQALMESKMMSYELMMKKHQTDLARILPNDLQQTAGPSDSRNSIEGENMDDDTALANGKEEGKDIYGASPTVATRRR